MATDILELPPGTLRAARMSVEELKLELALYLYEGGRLSEGKAREMTGLSHRQFRQHLAARGVGPKLTPEDVDRDLATLRRLDRS